MQAASIKAFKGTKFKVTTLAEFWPHPLGYCEAFVL